MASPSGPIGFVETLEAAKKSDHYKSPVLEGQGRGISAGFWFNRGGETTGSLTIAPDGIGHDRNAWNVGLSPARVSRSA